MVDGGDLNAAAALAIAPRATRSMETSPPPPPPPVEKAEETEDWDEAADETESKEDDEDDDDDGDEDDGKEGDEDEETRIAVEDLVFAPEDRPDEPSVSFGKLSPRAHTRRAGRAKKAVVFSFDRGRYVKPVIPRGRRAQGRHRRHDSTRGDSPTRSAKATWRPGRF